MRCIYCGAELKKEICAYCHSENIPSGELPSEILVIISGSRNSITFEKSEKGIVRGISIKGDRNSTTYKTSCFVHLRILGDRNTIKFNAVDYSIDNKGSRNNIL